MTSRERLTRRALDILDASPDGLRWSELYRKLLEEFSFGEHKIPTGTITGTLRDIEKISKGNIYKPEKGIFRHIKFKESVPPDKTVPAVSPVQRSKEEDFYKPFADWIKEELEECTKAIPLGRNKFGDKWGTPDVIGIRAPRQSDIIKPPTEIVSAEIKIDTSNLITAFGQSCSYKLFSHKSYIVVPVDSPEGDKARLDALCRIFGIGLILFDSKKPESPNFQIRVRAAKHDPDMFYVNRNIKLIERELFG
jgi:hypothetical protein